MGTAMKVSVAMVLLAGAGAPLALGAGLPSCPVTTVCSAVAAEASAPALAGERGLEVTSLLLLGGGLAFTAGLVRRPRTQE